jgi:ketosteroid isomerase-like protein
MSQENVDYVVARMPGPNVNLVTVVHDDLLWAAWEALLAADLHPDFECVQNLFGSATAYKGVAGLRTMMLDWVAPWTEYRIRIVEALDCGDRVVLVGEAFGRPHHGDHEVRTELADIWTIRDGKAIRWEAMPSRAEALEAVGREG